MGFEHVPPVFVVPTDHADGIVSSPHLKARGFFLEVDHPELNATITYPGAGNMPVTRINDFRRVLNHNPC